MAYSNIEDQRRYGRAHYKRNKAKYKRTALIFTQRVRIRNKAWIAEYLKTHPCIDCGEKDPIVLEFDHVRGQKKGNVSNLAQNVSIATLSQEVEKCEVRCANCHRRITHKRRIAG